ncbi:MAG: Gfo/Idh/MocA family oxidoreductase [Thermotogae bacterium]|nr:Gfo/Idh/MocA family oxidoreductase [Thermotogota bacterium]
MFFSNPVKVGVVGVGYLGSLHVKRLKEIPLANLVGIYDIDTQKGKSVAEEYGILSFPSLEDLIEEVEAVVVAAPTTAHYTIAKSCILSNRHVFVEKPLTDSLKTAAEIVHLSRERGVKVQVGHVERFNPAFLAAKDYIVGRVFFIESVRMSAYNPRGTDVDVILDLMIHDIDLTLSLMGEEPEMISAVGIPVVTGDIDIANVRLEFPSGAVANLTASRVSLEKMRKFRIFVMDRYLSVDLYRKRVDMVQKVGNELIPYFPPVDTGKDAITLELSAFLEAVRGKREVVVPAEEGYRNMLIASRIKKRIYERIRRVKDEDTGTR